MKKKKKKKTRRLVVGCLHTSFDVVTAVVTLPMLLLLLSWILFAPLALGFLCTHDIFIPNHVEVVGLSHFDTIIFTLLSYACFGNASAPKLGADALQRLHELSCNGYMQQIA